MTNSTRQTDPSSSTLARPARSRHTLLGYSACALAGSLWGCGFYFGRLALNEMSVEHMVLYRFLFACLGLVPITVHRIVRRGGLPRLTGEEVRDLLVAAAFGIPIQFLLQFHGLAMTTVSHASLMVGAMPVLLAAAAALFAHERLNAFGWTALVISTVGAALVTLGGHRGPAAQGQPSLAGDLLVLFSLVVALAWILLNKKTLGTRSAVAVTVFTIFSGTLMLIAVVVVEQLGAPLVHSIAEPFPFAHISLRAWLALAASGILCTATTTLVWNWGLHQVPASRAGVFLNIEPALGSLLGVELLGEKLGPYAWVGGALIVGAALALTMRDERAESELLLE